MAAASASAANAAPPPRDAAAIAADQGPKVMALALPGGIRLALLVPAAPDETERRLFASLGDNIARNAASVGLPTTWRTPDGGPAEPPAWRQALDRVLDPVPWLLLALAWLLWARRSAIADLPGRGWPHWAAVLAISAWTRATSSGVRSTRRPSWRRWRWR